jgi:hypothetical protein
MSEILNPVRLLIAEEIVRILQIEREQFGIQKICLVPGWMEGQEPKVWLVIDGKGSARALAELKSQKMSIWLPEACLPELDGQVLVRSNRGFTVGKITEILETETTLFLRQ